MSFTLQDYQKIEAEEWPQAQRLAEYLMQRFKPKKVIDIGCGTGLYLRPFHISGIQTWGYEISNDARKYSVCGDLENKDIIVDYPTFKQDLALCLETLEHISEDKAEQAITNLVRASDLIIFTAAQPGQGGIVHVNCQPKEYWRKLFAKHGYYESISESDALIKWIQQGYHMGWLVQNVMVMQKQPQIAMPEIKEPALSVSTGYRFHLLGLAHVPTSTEYFSCAYTQKIVKLAKMLKKLGHTVFFYGTEGSDVECDKFFTVGTKAERLEAYGDYDWKKDFFKHDPKDKVHQNFNARAVAEINQIKQERDFLLITMGNYHWSIADQVKLRFTVESGIGYSGIFALYKVFESYAWMHYLYGITSGMHSMQSEEHRKTHKDPGADGNWYDAVIWNYFDPADFHTSQKGDYYLYVGRLISRKGLSVACEVTEKLEKKLIVAGQGTLKDVDRMDLSKYKHVEHIGSIDPKQRADLMSGAIALFTPTYYIGPFEGVHAESMLCGTPCLTTDWGVFTETVIDGFNGFKCRTFSEFVNTAKLCEGLDSKAIRKWAISKFSMDVAAQKYQQYFDRLYDIWDKGWYQDRFTIANNVLPVLHS